jgi:membrane protease YdiL (CAAX protease family)
MKTSTRNILIWVEFILLFIGVPLLLVNGKIMTPSSILIPLVAGLSVYFYLQKDFKFREFIRLQIPRKTWIKQGLIVLLIGIILTLAVWIFEPENLFNLPRGNWKVWVGMFFFYPIFSAYAQEIIYRLFLFRRYRTIFRTKYALILASAITFSYAHIVYFSVLSLVLTFLAGVYLAVVYQKTKSVLFVSILHGALGFFIFTVGLGQHFWLDMMKWIQ